MYRAEIYYTMGFGLDRGMLVANSYAEINAKVNSWVEKNLGRIVKILGMDAKVCVEKVVFNYPSGKKFTKTF